MRGPRPVTERSPASRFPNSTPSLTELLCPPSHPPSVSISVSHSVAQPLIGLVTTPQLCRKCWMTRHASGAEHLEVHSEPPKCQQKHTHTHTHIHTYTHTLTYAHTHTHTHSHRTHAHSHPNTHTRAYEKIRKKSPQ
jgi:hypothetical protein